MERGSTQLIGWPGNDLESLESPVYICASMTATS